MVPNSVVPVHPFHYSSNLSHPKGRTHWYNHSCVVETDNPIPKCITRSIYEFIYRYVLDSVGGGMITDRDQHNMSCHLPCKVNKRKKKKLHEAKSLNFLDLGLGKKRGKLRVHSKKLFDLFRRGDERGLDVMIEGES